MKPEWRVIGIFSMLAIATTVSMGCKMLGLTYPAQADVKAYAKTLQGLNEDMRETLRKIRDQQNVAANTELLHDQLHVMRDILHLVDKAKRDNPTFKTLHDRNHAMRDRWHDLKKGREREANLGKLDNQLDHMKQVLQGVM